MRRSQRIAAIVAQIDAGKLPLLADTTTPAIAAAKPIMRIMFTLYSHQSAFFIRLVSPYSVTSADP